MARGTSGRVVVEIAPEIKRELHARLAREGRTLKEWFLGQANSYLAKYEPIKLEQTKGLDDEKRAKGKH